MFPDEYCAELLLRIHHQAQCARRPQTGGEISEAPQGPHHSFPQQRAGARDKRPAPSALKGYGLDPRVVAGVGEADTQRSLKSPVGTAPCCGEGASVAEEEQSSISASLVCVARLSRTLILIVIIPPRRR